MDPRKSSSRTKRSISLVLSLLLVFTIGVGPLGFPKSPAEKTYILQGSSVAQLVDLVQDYGGKITAQLPVINGVVATLDPNTLASLGKEKAVSAITPNSTVSLAGTPGGNGPQAPSTDYSDGVGADLAWQEGVIGSGITVAVVDTGLGNHKGLVRDVNGQVGNRILGWVDFVEGRNKPVDPNGHGTHVAGIIANTQLGEDGEWDGVAPGVNLVGVRVLNEEGQGSYEQVLQGIQWVIDHQDVYNIRVMNLSLVSQALSPYWADPLNQAVMQAWAKGIVVVVAAANSGPAALTIGVPGNNPYVITVGAFTDNHTPYNWSDDYITPFSAAGPTLDGFVKPDVVAPGAHIVSTVLPNSNLNKDEESESVSNHYLSIAGTSQAAAVVSGVSALVLSRNSDLTPDQVKFRIMYTALPWINLEGTQALYSMWQQGAGRVNARDAVLTDRTDKANAGLDVDADLAGYHYEGFSFFDEATGQFRLRGDFYSWDGGYGAWSGGYGAWSGGYGAWSGGYGAWSGSYGAWSGGYGAWSGSYGAWSGGYGAWSGGYGAWSGGYGAWSGGYGAWSGSVPWAGTMISDKTFLSNFITGTSPQSSVSVPYIKDWDEAP